LATKLRKEPTARTEQSKRELPDGATAKAHGNAKVSSFVMSEPPEAIDAVRVAPAPLQHALPRHFVRGARAPYAIRWYGISSLYGHFRSFISRAIAAEQVDSRDWMRAEPPDVLLANVLQTLGGAETAPTLAEGLGRCVYVDFTADTGDDRDTSQAVGAMLSKTYEVEEPNGEIRSLPRGEILMLGGDVAYPVATADEIHRRLTQPWNDALRDARVRGPTRKRILFGVPGNHDWYDGLDGFGRLFRKSVNLPMRHERKERTHRGLFGASIAKIEVGLRRASRNRKVGAVLRELHVDEVSGVLRIIGSVLRSLKAILQGGGKKRRRRLVLHGYVAAQEASYFSLPLAPGLELWGVDRQLGRMDFRQRSFFQKIRKKAPDARIVFLASDPASAYGEPNAPGQSLLKACRLSLERDQLLYLTGDFHHYERRMFNRSAHVIAGGGGAFLHGTRINESPSGPAAAEYPPRAVSRALVRHVPWKLMIGHSGYLIHLAGGLVAALISWSMQKSQFAFACTSACVSLLSVATLYFIAGHGRTHPKQSLLLSVPFGLLLAALPMTLAVMLPGPLFRFIPWLAPWLTAHALVLLASAFASAFVFGLFLMTAAILGLEHQQAFTVLGHPGYKHFVRLCIHPSGRIEAFVFGKDDPLVPGAPSLVDRFEWDASKNS
jgi:hypothetical protein